MPRGHKKQQSQTSLPSCRQRRVVLQLRAESRSARLGFRMHLTQGKKEGGSKRARERGSKSAWCRVVG